MIPQVTSMNTLTTSLVSKALYLPARFRAKDLARLSFYPYLHHFHFFHIHGFSLICYNGFSDMYFIRMRNMYISTLLTGILCIICVLLLPTRMQWCATFVEYFWSYFSKDTGLRVCVSIMFHPIYSNIMNFKLKWQLKHLSAFLNGISQEQKALLFSSLVYTRLKGTIHLFSSLFLCVYSDWNHLLDCM